MPLVSIDLTEDEISTIAKRVLKHMEDNMSNMLQNLSVKVKAENVEGLDDIIEQAIGDALDNCSVSVDAEFNHR